MADHSESLKLSPPSDVERTQVLARVILERIAWLEALKTGRDSFTPERARELFVLEHLRDDWLLEAKRSN